MNATITRPDSTQTRAQDDAAALWAASHLADLPGVVRLTDAPIRLRTDTEGVVWRHAFVVTLRLQEPARFMIHLCAGASSRDLERAQSVIARARLDGLTAEGNGGALWVAHEDRWRYSVEVRQNDELRHYDELRGCEVPVCAEQFHSWVDGEQSMVCGLPPIHGEGYFITGMLWDGVWHSGATVDFDAENGEGLEILRALATDYERMHTTCERLNEESEKRNAA